MIDYSEGLIELKRLTNALEGQLRRSEWHDGMDTLADIKATTDKLRNWLWHNPRGKGV